MGDVADYYLEQEDYFGEDWPGWEEDGYRKPGITCRFCGTTGLFWNKLDGKWRLFNDKGLHTCERYVFG